MSLGLYTLKGHLPVPCKDTLEWGKWMQTADRVVAQDRAGDIMVSTVFLGIDHNWLNVGPPILFETMIFGGPLDGDMSRYSTWAAAEAGHATTKAKAFQYAEN